MKKFKERMGQLVYTLKHKRAFLQVERQLLGHNTLAGFLHDLDKVIMCLVCFGVDVETIHKWHTKINRHHAECRFTQREKDRMQMLIDWECGRMTKPDKQLNAWDAMCLLHPQVKEIMRPLFEKYLPHEIRDDK